MTDRDTFAAAALTGLLVHANDDIDEETLDTPSDIAYTAYQMADAMLRERERTNHDAAPAARANAESVAPQPTAGDRSGNPTSHSGTGKQPAPPCVEADGFSPGSRTGPISRTPERESPRRECGESALRDVPQLDNSRAAGGPEHHISEAEIDAMECVVEDGRIVDLSQPCMVDPPSGWQWGFPRRYDPASDGPMKEWLVRNGYPKHLADKGLTCTFTLCGKETARK